LVIGGFDYEVMYLFDVYFDDMFEDFVYDLCVVFDGFGEFMVVVGGGGLWNVYVYIDDVGGVIEVGIVVGCFYCICVICIVE